MKNAIHELSNSEKNTVKLALQATSEGPFFEEWEFQTLMGVDRSTLQDILNDWPEQKVENNEFICAIMNSLANLIGYPHGQEAELAKIIPGGIDELERIANKLIKYGF